MARFAFRLQRVLDFREVQEDSAERAFLAARARRIEALRHGESIAERRRTVLKTDCASLGDHQALERYSDRLDDEDRAQEVVIQVLRDEEEQLMQIWQSARQEAEALRKLRDRDEEAHRHEEERRQQAEMDELAVRRRAS